MKLSTRFGLALAVVLAVVPALVGSTAAQAKPRPTIEVAVAATEVEMAPTPCSTGLFTVELTNHGSTAVFATAYVDGGGLDLSAKIITTYLPAGYTYTEDVQIMPTTTPGEHTVRLTAGESRDTVRVVIDDSGIGDNLARYGEPSASSMYPGRPPCAAVDGNTDSEAWSAGVGWSDGTNSSFPDWWAIDFAEPVTISSVTLYTLDSAALPADKQGLRDWDIQVPDGDGWRTVASVRGNTDGVRTSTFPAVTTTAVRVLCLSANGNYSRILEFEARA